MGKHENVVGECEVDGRLFYLMEINEYALPLISLFVNETQTQDLNSTEIAWYHQQMIADLVERCKSGDRLALWASLLRLKLAPTVERSISRLSCLKECGFVPLVVPCMTETQTPP